MRYRGSKIVSPEGPLLQNLTLNRNTVGGVEADISTFEDALTGLKEVGES